MNFSRKKRIKELSKHFLSIFSFWCSWHCSFLIWFISDSFYIYSFWICHCSMFFDYIYCLPEIFLLLFYSHNQNKIYSSNLRHIKSCFYWKHYFWIFLKSWCIPQVHNAVLVIHFTYMWASFKYTQVNILFE